MRKLTPRDENDILKFKRVTGKNIAELDRYLSGDWEWDELWDYNFQNVEVVNDDCKCKFEGLRASGRREGYPKSIHALERLGFQFKLIEGGGSWYVDAYYQCTCGQIWKEEFVEAMQYNGNHAYPVESM